MQVTILTPSVGSKGYEEPYETGMVIEQAGGKKVDDYQYDGNHCIATNDPQPWRKQLNMYLAYASFYNPLNFVRAILNWKDPVWKFRVIYQTYGMVGMAKSIRRGFGWLRNLYLGPVHKKTEIPQKPLPVIAANAQTV